MPDRIRWLRLQKIATEIANRKVTINLTTSSKITGYRALTEFNSQSMLVYMNGCLIKSVEEVIDALAHELAHVTLGTKDHGNEFDLEWARIRSLITERYN
jgi:predicted metal-dependent hydrolase